MIAGPPELFRELKNRFGKFENWRNIEQRTPERETEIMDPAKSSELESAVPGDHRRFVELRKFVGGAADIGFFRSVTLIVEVPSIRTDPFAW
jgi:hypothetical protein